MEKRLHRSDLVFSLSFLLMLIIAIGAFFYGVKVGTDRTDAKYEADAAATKKTDDSGAKPPNAYQQQDLVSFYHTVFLPYREFQTSLFEERNLWLDDSTIDRSDSLKQLGKLARKKYDAIRTAYVSPSSPVLKDAQASFVRSLKLFSDGFGDVAGKANEGAAAAVLETLDANSLIKEGKLQGLTGQEQYFVSMLKWGSTVNLDIPAGFSSPKVFSIGAWKSLPLLVKNKVTAHYLTVGRYYSPYLPQDLTARIDQLIASGQTDKMKLKTIGSVAELLTDTDAVRSGDFLRIKPQLYDKELLPQLPFFSQDN